MIRECHAQEQEAGHAAKVHDADEAPEAKAKAEEERTRSPMIVTTATTG